MEHNERPVSRTVSAVKNVIFNMAYQVINTVVNIIVPPLIIGAFGSVTNGLISTIKQIMNYVQLVGAGISESTVVSLYKPLNEHDNKKTSSIYKAVAKTFNKSGIWFSVASVLIALIYPLFVSEDLPYYFIAFLVIIISISGVSEFFLIGKYRTLLIADQKMYIVNIAQIVGAVLSSVLTIVLIKLNLGIILVQFASAMAYVCRIIVLAIYIKKSYKNIDSSASPDYSAVSKRKAATIHQVAGLVIFGSQTLIVAQFCGFAEASVYSVYNLIFTGINTILATFSSAMLAGMGSLLTIGDNERVKKVYEIYELVYQILTFTVYITALIMIKPFIILYTSGADDVVYMRTELVFLFIIMGLFNCLRTPGATMINAKGHYDETKNRALIEMSICLVGQLLFVQFYGVVGVLVGTISAYLYRTLDVIIYSNVRILKRSPIKTLLRDIRYILILAIAGYVFLNMDIKTSGYFDWIIIAVLVAIITIIIVFIASVIFDRKTLSWGFEYFKEIIRGRK